MINVAFTEDNIQFLIALLNRADIKGFEAEAWIALRARVVMAMQIQQSAVVQPEGDSPEQSRERS